MSFFGNNQQAQLMAHMFQNPQGGGMPAPQPGYGGAGSGVNLGPSFGGPEGAQGVQNMPFDGHSPDFSMSPFQPTTPAGIRDLGPAAGMPAPPVDQLPYEESDGFGQGFSRGFKPENPPRPGERPPVDRMPYPAGSGSSMPSGYEPGMSVGGRDNQPRDGGMSEEDRKRQVLIEAIMKKAFGR